MRAAELRIGVDVGGTSTDAVVLDGDDRLLAATKATTTDDPAGGIVEAVRGVLGGGIGAERVTHVMIGTTHATNAVLQRRGLRRTAVVRIGAPSTGAVPPLLGWPDDLRRAVSAGECVIDGGAELDGREIVAFGADQLARFLRSLPAPVDSVAITSAFAPVSADHERAAAEVVARELGPGAHVSLSHRIGTLGLLERENATVLNEALVGAVHGVLSGLAAALADAGLGHAAVHVTQNDGTLMSLDDARHLPVLMIGSGPANSIRGAARLTGLGDAVVVDVGGTSTDIGVLVNGFPRESPLGVRIGGIETNFRMPDLIGIALGGGSVVAADGGRVTVGPDSVGHRLPRQALAFGGPRATLTDTAVAAGRARIGTAAVADRGGDLARALAVADDLVADGVDRIKAAGGDVPVVAVGGGSVLLADRLPGASRVLRTEHHDVANAIGAAIGTVGGQLDRVYPLAGTSRDEVLRRARDRAVRQAVRAGADPARVEVVDLEEIPLAYLSDPAIRVRVKAAGPLASLAG